MKVKPQDIIKILKNDRDLYSDLKEILKFLLKNNDKFYFVGGFVRDAILSISYDTKLKVQDIDIVVETKDYISLVNKLKNLNLKKIKEIKQNSQFLTFSILFSSNIRVDLSLPRKEKYEFSGALPKVELAEDIKEDFFRRDFSINSIALRYCPEDRKYEFFDPYRGIEDLMDRKIRVLHDKSFIDDPTRILRAIRFAGSLNFEIEEHTEKLLKEALEKNVLFNISEYRLNNEFLNIIKKGRNLNIICKYFEKYRILNYYKSIYNLVENFLKFYNKLELKEIYGEEKYYMRLMFLLERTVGEVELFQKDKINKFKEYLIKLNVNKKEREKIYEALNVFLLGKSKNIPMWVKKYSKIFDKKIVKLPITAKKLGSLGVPKNYINKVLSYIVNNKIKRVDKVRIKKILDIVKFVG
jgi:tRNA nucleotidyltransferase (CCA-adding enzyme)